MWLYSRVTLQWRDVERGLEAMPRVNLRHAFGELKRPLKADQRDHAKKRTGPESLWAPRAPSTLALAGRKIGGWHRRARRPMGKLPTGVRYRADATGIRGVSMIRWSAVHMDGGTVGRGSRLPARPFLWISDEMLTTAENTIGAAVVAAYGGK